MTVFLCKDSFEGIMAGIYQAWTSRLGHANVRLDIETASYNYQMFTEYVAVIPQKQQVNKVVDAIRSKISQQVYEYVYKASLSNENEKADKIYRYLICAFHVGAGIVKQLQIPEVYEVFRMCRGVQNEFHLLRGFVRFAKTEHGILYGRISPENDVLELLSDFFSDRFRSLNWILVDERRKKAAVFHAINHMWLIVWSDSEYWKSLMQMSTDEEAFADLWKAYHNSIAIKERENPVCQRTHLPLRFRPYMTEFEHFDKL